MVLSIALGFFPFLSYSQRGDPNSNLTHWAIYIYFGGMAVSMLINFSHASYIKRKVIEVLDYSYSISKDEATKEVRRRMVKTENEGIIQALVQGPIYLTF